MKMMIVTDKQMEAFRQIEEEKFIIECEKFLKNNFPKWILMTKKIKVKQFINDIIKFCAECEIKRKGNIQKMMFFKIKYEFEIPLSQKLYRSINQEDTNEDYRVKCFYKKLDNHIK